MTSLPPDLDVEAFVAHALGTDDPDVRPDWRNRLLGTDPARAVGQAATDRCMTLRMTHEFAHRISAIAAEQGMSRSAYIRRAVIAQAEQDLDLPPGSLAGGMLKRTEHRR